MRKLVWLVVTAGLGGVLSLSACGGGGGEPPPPPPPPDPLYVRVNGDDTNTGDQNDPLRTISKAAQIARSGYEIIVGPGTYREGVTFASVGAAPQGVKFTADIAGAQTGGRAGPVIVDASGARVAAGFSLSNTKGTVIDGFTITGASDAGIVIKSGSDNFTIQNCIVFSNEGDGIRVQDSQNVLVLNNLVYGNAGTGVDIVGQTSGSPNATVVNNTIFGNRFRGIEIGTTTRASQGAFLRNNIVQSNSDLSVRVYAPPPSSVPRSDVGYSGDFNLVLPATYVPDNVAGRHDIAQDAAFVNAGGGDFHLRSNSPAINAGDSLNNMQQLANMLRGKTTTGGTDCDKSALDLGYHYPPSGRCTSVGQ